MVPPLEPHCGSWIIIDRATGRAVFETWSWRTAAAVNFDRYEVLTAAQHLGEVNRAYRAKAEDRGSLTDVKV